MRGCRHSTANTGGDGWLLCEIRQDGMRLDKFLKESRLIKRRTIANALCDCGGALLDGKMAKASTEPKEGQTLELRFGNRTIAAQIIGVPSATQKRLKPDAMVAAVTITPVVRAGHPIDDLGDDDGDDDESASDTAG